MEVKEPILLSKTDPEAAKREHRKTTRWVIQIFVITLFVSGTISFLSDEIMDNSNIFIAFLILLVIVLVGIVFDIIGVAVTSADEKPFHSMAARKVPGAHEAIRLLRNAERVSSICNDVIGDICGVVSGSASATIAAEVIHTMEGFSWPRLITLAMSATVAALTVGGKAIGTTFAINSSTPIIHGVGRILYVIHNFPKIVRKKK